MMKWKIKQMDLTDLGSVYAIEARAHETPWTKDIILQCLLTGYECDVLVVYENNDWKPIGYMVQRVHNRTLHLLNICVDPRYHGKGFGRILLNYCFETAQLLKKLVSEILLEVRVSNTIAIQLYKKNGFKQVDVLKDYYRDIDKTEDAFIFVKKLS